MRFDEVNEAGGIHGRKIKLIVEDQAVPGAASAVQACNKLINRDNVFAFVAPLGTPMNNACFKDQFDGGRAQPVPALGRALDVRAVRPAEVLRRGLLRRPDPRRHPVLRQEEGQEGALRDVPGHRLRQGDPGRRQMQAEKLGIKIVETAAHKPTDQDFTAPITKLQGGRLRPGRHGHHRARLDRALRHRAQDGLDRRRLPRLGRGLRPRSWPRPRAGDEGFYAHGPHRDALRDTLVADGQDVRRALQGDVQCRSQHRRGLRLRRRRPHRDRASKNAGKPT